jgi:4-amino-4-deoxy-L-arabinose transferase-like glycosyltransferase
MGDPGEMPTINRKDVFMLLVFILVAAHFGFLLAFFEPAISTPDAQSYYAQARLLATKGRTYVKPESPLQYIGPHWQQTKNNRYYCTHAPGFAAILAPIYKIFGPEATLYVNPIMASLSLLGLFLLCRLWVGDGWALLAAALMAVNPFANEHALFGFAHTPVCFFLIWGLFFLIRRKTRFTLWRAIIVGLCMGIIPTIRYPEVIYLPAIVIFTFLHFRDSKVPWRSLIAGVIFAAIPIIILCIRNQIAYGAFWRTGYALAIPQKLFGWGYFTNNSVRFLQQLMGEGCGLISGLGVAGIAILCARRDTRKSGVLFALLVVPVTLLYMAYFWRPDRQSMRFLLPTFYIYTIAGVWLLSTVTANHRSSAWVSGVIVFLITTWWGLPQSCKAMEQLKSRNAALAQVTDVVEEHIEPGSILIVCEGINQHLDFIGYWRLIDLRFFMPHRPEPPRMFAPNQNNILPIKVIRSVEALQRYEKLKGKELFNAVSDDLRQWAGNNRKVYVLADEKQIDILETQLMEIDKLVIIEKIELPAAGPDRRDLAMGFGPPGFGPPISPSEDMPPEERGGFMPPPQGPQGPNRIFDLVINGEPLLLVEWLRKSL